MERGQGVKETEDPDSFLANAAFLVLFLVLAALPLLGMLHALEDNEVRKSGELHASLIQASSLATRAIPPARFASAAEVEARLRPLRPRNLTAWSAAELLASTGEEPPLTQQEPTNERMRSVRDALANSWDAYVRDAWGCDELRPLTRRGRDCEGGMGLTILDALGTLHIAKLDGRFAAAREWVATELDFSKVDKDVNLFETTIRAMGGLLSIHALTGVRVHAHFLLTHVRSQVYVCPHIGCLVCALTGVRGHAHFLLSHVRSQVCVRTHIF